MRTTISSAAVLLSLMLIAGCGSNKTVTGPAALGAGPISASAVTGPRSASTTTQTSPVGVASEIPAYYDSMLFTINFTEFPPGSESTLQKKNPGLNFIYQSDPGLPGGSPFISVIDAIPTDGMNPLWEEIQIAFTAGHTPRQLFSDDEIAAAKATGEITLTDTHELYHCSVVAKPR